MTTPFARFWAIMMGAGLLLSSMMASAQNVIRLNAVADANGRYAQKMIELAISKLDTPYRLEIGSESSLTQARNIEEVSAGRYDLMWAATDQGMEDALLPIRICLYKGLLGYRVFIIHKDNQALFDRINSLDDLKTIKLGQGTTWADTKILESNGLTVVKANKYESLFYMVDGGRFDAFPRGVQEPWAEIPNYPTLNLAVEKRLMLSYRMPFYLFTGKNNPTLAKDLEEGFNRAIADGSFDEVFLNDPMVKSVLEKANFENRIVFEINNPTLPAATPLDRAELWLNIDQLKKPAEPATTVTDIPSAPASSE